MCGNFISNPIVRSNGNYFLLQSKGIYRLVKTIHIAETLAMIDLAEVCILYKEFVIALMHLTFLLFIKQFCIMTQDTPTLKLDGHKNSYLGVWLNVRINTLKSVHIIFTRRNHDFLGWQLV